MYNSNKKNKIKKNISNDRGNKICCVAAILVGRSERGNKRNFNLSPIVILKDIHMYLMTAFEC
jgi:hypothetical protein